jgi:hypothetical protein
MRISMTKVGDCMPGVEILQIRRLASEVIRTGKGVVFKRGLGATREKYYIYQCPSIDLIPNGSTMRRGTPVKLSALKDWNGVSREKIVTI